MPFVDYDHSDFSNYEQFGDENKLLGVYKPGMADLIMNYV